MASRSRAPTRVFELGPRTATAPLRDASAGHHHHARSAVAAVGLERQPPARPEHLPSDRPGPCGPGGLAALVVHSHRSPRTLSLAASLGLPRQGPPGRLELSRASANRLAAICFDGEKDAPHRFLQPTSFTSTLRTAVFPAAPPRRSPPCGGSRRFERRLTLGHGRAASRSWGDLSVRFPGEPTRWSPCLTAKLQLQPSPQPSREPPKGCLWRARELCPERPREGHDAVLVEPRSATLPRPACRSRCSRP